MNNGWMGIEKDTYDVLFASQTPVAVEFHGSLGGMCVGSPGLDQSYKKQRCVPNRDSDPDRRSQGHYTHKQ